MGENKNRIEERGPRFEATGTVDWGKGGLRKGTVLDYVEFHRKLPRPEESLGQACQERLLERLCFFYAITIKEEAGEVDPNLCLGCGVCVDRCDHGAISLDGTTLCLNPWSLKG
jgi:NAD-dependent dihydropyrimidine dehydrogenase PreA subunit